MYSPGAHSGIYVFILHTMKKAARPSEESRAAALSHMEPPPDLLPQGGDPPYDDERNDQRHADGEDHQGPAGPPGPVQLPNGTHPHRQPKFFNNYPMRENYAIRY